MYSENGLLPSAPACSEGTGVMPACAPLAVPYVPYQQSGSVQYSQAEALNNGTLFPGLDLPFHIKAKAANVVDTPLAELQALDFVLHELALYLDTHESDEEAFALYRRYATMAEEGRQRYEQIYGPLSMRAAAMGRTYDWTRAPWPWEVAHSEGVK